MTKRISMERLCEMMILCYNLWYILPVLRAVASSGIYQSLFFGINILGLAGLLWIKRGKLRISSFMCPILLMLVFFCVLTICSVGEMAKHIKLCVSFWSTSITYMVLDKDQRVRVAKILLVAILVTTITSSIAVWGDNNVARVLTDSRASDSLQLSYKLRNISSIYLFQCFSVFVPVLLALAKKQLEKVVAILAIIYLLLSVINASFTISLIIFLFSCAISIVLKTARGKKAIIVSMVSIVTVTIMLSNIDVILSWMIQLIDNDRITSRLERIILAFGYANVDVFALGARGELYMMSLRTFAENFFGVGPYYAFTTGVGGLGYHSQILDDLGRYGLFALLFYVAFFAGYYQMLKKEWKKVGAAYVATCVTCIYALLLLCNIGFKAAEEGVIMLFIIPSLPEIVLSIRKKRENLVTARVAIN